MKRNLLLVLLIALSCITISNSVFAQLVQVQGLYETDLVTAYNAADDPAIYLHPRDGDSSFFLGTDKQTDGRIELYDLDGTRFWSTPTGQSINNVDVLYGFVLSGDTIDIVGASNRTQNRLEMYMVDDTARNLINITGNTAAGFTQLYGFAFYKDVCAGKYYAFLTLKNSSGFVYQYELTDNGNGQIDATLVRQILNLPTRTEGLAIDQTLGNLYVAEEEVGVWKYSAHSFADDSRVLMDSVTGNGNLAAAVEGITIYYATDTTGYIMVASQSLSTYQVYDRAGNNAFLGEFEIITGTVSDCYKADGIDVLAYPMGSTYPQGVFISHDNGLAGEYTNYMTVPWERIADSLGLTIASKDPRTIGDFYCENGYDSTITVSEIQPNLHLEIMPNPFSNEIRVDWDLNAPTLFMELIDTFGSVIWSGTVQQGETIQLPEMKAGAYYIRSGTTVEKLFKVD